MRTHDLAQLNIAKLLHPIDSAELQDFVGNLDRINALAENSDGFIWRLIAEFNSAVDQHYFGPDVIVNMSTWHDVKALHAFVYRSAHTEILKRRKEWFSEMKHYSVMWWIPHGTTPTIAEARERLTLLEKKGPTEQAFVFNQMFEPQ